jgi:hypothetical protein
MILALSLPCRPPVKGGVSEANAGLVLKNPNPPLNAFAPPLDRGAAQKTHA